MADLVWEKVRREAGGGRRGQGQGRPMYGIMFDVIHA